MTTLPRPGNSGQHFHICNDISALMTTFPEGAANIFGATLRSEKHRGHMDRRPYEIALDQAKSELQEVTELIERLRVRKGLVESTISALQLVLESPPIEAVQADSTEAIAPPFSAVPGSTREMVIFALKEAGRPLTVPEIHEQIRLTGVSPVPERDAIRVLMTRRKDIFRVLGRGQYELAEPSGEAQAQTESAQEPFRLQWQAAHSVDANLEEIPVSTETGMPPLAQVS